MAHPYFHSISSVKVYGGVVTDYLPIHNWFDASKQIACDFRHRALRHHREGISLAERIFGRTLTNSDHREVPTREIGEQHVHEDLGEIPTASKWYQDVEFNPSSRPRKITTEKQTKESQSRWGGVPEDYLSIHEFLDERYPRIANRLIPHHHSLGIFDCESIFGEVIHNSIGRPIPVRVIAEKHINDELGSIPPTLDLIQLIKPKPWMLRVAKPSRVILSEV